MHRHQMFSRPWLRAVALWGSLSFVSQLQSGNTNFANNQANITATVSAVVTARSVLVMHGYRNGYAGAADPSIEQARGVITNSTTLTFSRGSFTATVNDFVTWTLIEFMPGVVKSIQTIAATIAGGQTIADTAITTVTVGKSVIFQSQNNSAAGALSSVSFASVRLSSATNARAERSTSDAGITVSVGAQVVEFF